MTHDSLPDDVRFWPDDPAQLLGVPENADRKTLRRAYSQLVRRFKPEHAPDAFQRIRAAYDALLQECHWRELFGSALDDSEADDSETGDDAGNRDSSGEALDSNPSTAETEWDLPIPPDPTASLWEAAINGKPADAYCGYRELHEQSPGNEDVALRLYWLLKIDPTLDRQRQPVDWLFEALQHDGLCGRALGLYDDELLEDPSLVNVPRAARLLHVPAPAGQLAQLAHSHIRSAGQLRRWEKIRECLDVLRPRIADDDPAVWLRVLVAALDVLVWSTDYSAMSLQRDVSREFAGYEHLELALNHDFDRIDLLRDLSRECLENRGANGISRELFLLFTTTWNRWGYEIRPALLDVLEPWVANPDLGLDALDRLYDQSRAALGRLMELVESSGVDLPNLDASDRGTDLLKRRLRNLLAEQGWPSYGELRIPLRDFCLAEGITLKAVEVMLANDPDDFSLTAGDEQLVHYLANDAALDCLLQAHLAFWG